MEAKVSRGRMQKETQETAIFLASLMLKFQPDLLNAEPALHVDVQSSFCWPSFLNLEMFSWWTYCKFLEDTSRLFHSS